jgi:hypothetical protein
MHSFGSDDDVVPLVEDERDGGRRTKKKQPKQSHTQDPPDFRER